MTNRWMNQCIKCGAPLEGLSQPEHEERIYLEDRVDELEDMAQEIQSQIDMLKERVDALERNQNRNPERSS